MDEPASHASAIRLLVRSRGGKLVLDFGQPLPLLREDACAELIIHASDLVDDSVREQLTREQRVEFLPQGETLWARVRPEELPAHLRPLREPKRSLKGGNYLYVPLVLKETLHALVSEGNEAVLEDCACHVPALPSLGCRSVNEAYTRISEAFEPTRRSHTGNVFACVGLVGRDQIWRPLQETRDQFRRPPQSELALQG